MPCGASSPGLARGPGVSEGASLVGPQGPSLLWRGLKTLPICSLSPSPDARSPSSPGLRGSLPPSVLPLGKAVCWWRLLSPAPGGREGNDPFPPPRSRSRARGLPAPPRPRLQHPPRGPAGPSPRRAEGAGPPPSAVSRARLARGRAAEGSVTRVGGGHFRAVLGDLGSPPRAPPEAHPSSWHRQGGVRGEPPFLALCAVPLTPPWLCHLRLRHSGILQALLPLTSAHR